MLRKIIILLSISIELVFSCTCPTSNPGTPSQLKPDPSFVLRDVIIDGVNYIPMMTLTADAGKILTNGETSVYSITVEADEVNLWREIPDKVN